MMLVGIPTFDWDIGSWRDRARCRTSHPDLFFPVGNGLSARDQAEEAKMVCEGCEAREACLLFALETNQESGVWGGTWEDERRLIRKRWLAARRQRRAS